MSVHSAKKIAEIAAASDPKRAIIHAVGDLSKQDVFGDLVLVGTFIRSENYGNSGLILPTEYLKEDEYQSKVGLVLKTGPYAYTDWEDEPARGQNARAHTWVVFAIKDTWPVQINGAPCRFVPYERIRMRLTDPTLVF